MMHPDVAFRPSRSSLWHEVRNSIAYYVCPLAECDEVLRLTEPVPCPQHGHLMMRFLAKELPNTSTVVEAQASQASLAQLSVDEFLMLDGAS